MKNKKLYFYVFFIVFAGYSVCGILAFLLAKILYNLNHNIFLFDINFMDIFNYTELLAKMVVSMSVIYLLGVFIYIKMKK
ncbi:hypothetical protein [Otariodibacter oris]|uniref:Uncharacterized protein n=1 Tax=Otariodibacter oris TaxID=1032623 RepID=A0A420XIB6_9PAST|nr:hypothetical protein [Otariodibacter oris]QGM80842.1 hypothetical protein A6A10_05210 [Otariodibacter oris]RKR76986.1 hypothetical protein DES31_0299 [Otariodibacter oris]